MAMTAPSWRTTTVRAFVREIEQMKRSVGKCMCRGLLRKVARVWNPKDIRDPAIQQKVLAHMQAAGRGFRRLDAALERVGPNPLTPILGSLKLQSIHRVDNLQTLDQIVIALEAAGGRWQIEPVSVFRFLPIVRSPNGLKEPLAKKLRYSGTKRQHTP